MFVMEDRVNRRQSNVLVAAAITRDKVHIEQFIVVGTGRLSV